MVEGGKMAYGTFQFKIDYSGLFGLHNHVTIDFFILLDALFHGGGSL